MKTLGMATVTWNISDTLCWSIEAYNILMWYAVDIFEQSSTKKKIFFSLSAQLNIQLLYECVNELKHFRKYV